MRDEALMKARWNVEDKLLRLNTDELAVVEYVVDGLIAGLTNVGSLDLATDTRDFAEEANQELRDMLVYRACEVLKRRGK